MLDIIIVVFFLILLVNSNISIIKKYKFPLKYVNQLQYLLAYHLFFSLFFTWYILNFGGDSSGYWAFAMEQVVIEGEKTWFSYYGEGTLFILWLSYIPSQLMGLSYVTGNILFGFLGFIGIRYIFVLVADKFPTNYEILGVSLFPIFFYFLNLHFWTAGVGKDAVCFWGIAWFLFSIQEYKSRWWQAAIALFFVYMARPHMGQALISGAGLAILFSSDVKLRYKIVLGGITVIVAILLLPSTLETLRIEELSIESLDNLANSKVGNLNNSSVGSAFDLASYSWPIRLFSYLFRPLFFDAHNFVSLFSSFENSIYLYLTFFIYRNWSLRAIREMPLFLKAGMLAFIPVTLAFMNALSNTGITMRMKNMVMIYFLLFCFYLISSNKHMRLLRLNEKIDFYKKRQATIDSKKSKRSS